MRTIHRPFTFGPVLALFSALVLAAPAGADLITIKEVTIAPKGHRLAAVPGPVNHDSAVRLAEAEVDIVPGPAPAGGGPLAVEVRAVFRLVNAPGRATALTVGFPVSDSRFSAFDCQAFEVSSGGRARSVFNRVTAYPRRLEHAFVSGPDPAGFLKLPDVAEAVAGGELDPTGRRSNQIFPEDRIGGGVYHNLMVWGESFGPGEERAIEVVYRISIPLQKNQVVRKKAQGSHKGTWPEEANNLPLGFLKTLPEGDWFYFFDYYLVSGASWQGTIGRETVRLTLDRTWAGRPVHCSRMDRLARTEADGRTTYTYLLVDEEPAENLYFGLGGRPQ